LCQESLGGGEEGCCAGHQAEKRRLPFVHKGVRGIPDHREKSWEGLNEASYKNTNNSSMCTTEPSLPLPHCPSYSCPRLSVTSLLIVVIPHGPHTSYHPT